MKEYLIHADVNKQCFSICRRTEEEAIVELINRVVNDEDHASFSYSDGGVPVIASRCVELPDFGITIREDGKDISVRTYRKTAVDKLCLDRIMRYRQLNH